MDSNTPRLYFTLFLLCATSAAALSLTKDTSSNSISSDGSGSASLNTSLSSSSQPGNAGNIDISGNTYSSSNNNGGDYPSNFVSSASNGYGSGSGQIVIGSISAQSDSEGSSQIDVQQNQTSTTESNVVAENYEGGSSASAAINGSASSVDAVSTLNLNGGASTGNNGGANAVPPPAAYDNSYANANGQVGGTGDIVVGSISLNDTVNPSTGNATIQSSSK